MDIAYHAFTVMPFHFPELMWVPDTIVILERGDTRSIHRVLLDQGTWCQGMQCVDVLDYKIKHGSVADSQPLRSPTPGAVAPHVGRTWVTDSLEEREEMLARAPSSRPPRSSSTWGLASTFWRAHGPP